MRYSSLQSSTEFLYGPPESIDPISRHPKPLQPYVDEVKVFLEVSIRLCRDPKASNRLPKRLRQNVLRRILSLVDGVLGLEDGYLWSLHQDAEGRTGDDVRLDACIV